MNDYSQGSASDSSPVKAIVKWFSPRKGFGFVVPETGGKDVFLHISAVTQSGHESLPDGTTITCTIGQGQKGSEVRQIVTVDTSTAVESSSGDERPRHGGGFGDRPRRERSGGFNDRPPRQDFRPSGPATEMTGTVKWYNSQKGFGFVMPEDGSRDVFIHMSALRRSGIQSLDEGQSVRMRVVSGGKGQEAETVEII